MALFDDILAARGITEREKERYLNPDYSLEKGDPFLLSEMDKAVERLLAAHQKQEKIVIYGDYDIDGLSATTLLLDAFSKFGFKKVEAFIPNRFVEGYGMTIGAVDKVEKMGADLIVTVDCGSLNHAEIGYAKEKGIDTIVTDHHNIAETRPPAVAAINPKYNDHNYPFRDLCGAGVAFKLVQALQTKMDGLDDGYEKWLLDLVALGTVCDIVTLKGENRANVYWGLEVMKKKHRPGIEALMKVASVESEKVSARSLGFGIGPRINAAGRLETAQFALDVLTAKNRSDALVKADHLNEINSRRRKIQDDIFAEAFQQAEKMTDDNVLVISSQNWNHGVIGIVAAKILEKFKKPVYILDEKESGEATGSARSFGDFSAADAIRSADDLIIKGGGHAAAAGVTLKVDQIPAFRKRVNEFYHKKGLNPEEQLENLLPKADIEIADFSEINLDLAHDIEKMEPFGNGNPEPIFKISDAVVVSKREMGSEGQHLKLKLSDKNDKYFEVLAFNADSDWYREPGSVIDVWFALTVNEWNGNSSVEGRLLHLT